MNEIDELIEKATELRNILLEVKELSNHICNIRVHNDDFIGVQHDVEGNETITLGQSIAYIAR